jgi:hypothetical protein
MPIDKSWGQVDKPEYVAQITDLTETVDTFENNRGEQEDIRRIYVELDDVNPEVLSRFPLRFRASKHRSSSWMKWLKVIEHLGVPCEDDPNVLITKFVHVREEPEANEINGEMVEWIFPRVVEITDSEARAKEIFETLPKVVVASKGGIDADTKQEILQLYKSLAGIKDNGMTFKTAVASMLPEGLTADQAWAMATAVDDGVE